MTAKKIYVGAAFLIPSGTLHDPDQKHMFVVCTDIDEDGNVVLACVSSWKNNLCDDTCVLDVGCHPFITKLSYVLYRKSRVEHQDALVRGLEQARVVQIADVPKKIVELMLHGFVKSKQTPWRIKKIVKKKID